MISGSNTVILRGNMVADPEFAGNNDSIAKFGLAVSYAGNDSANPDNKAGFFNCVCYVNNAQGGDFLKRMMKENKVSKGSSVEVVGALTQERWKGDQGNRSRVVVVVEHFGFASGGRTQEEGSAERTATTTSTSDAGDSNDSFLDF